MMKLFKNHQQSLACGFLILAVCILIGAFGAHGLEKQLSAKMMKTFQTGVTYHRLAGVLWLILALVQQKFEDINFAKCFLLLGLGILFFSFNCYAYAITEIKILARLMPIGGIFFTYACFLSAWKLFRYQK